MSHILHFFTQPMGGLDHQLGAGDAAGGTEEVFWLGKVRR